jgi:hypothetical protein
MQQRLQALPSNGPHQKKGAFFAALCMRLFCHRLNQCYAWQIGFHNSPSVIILQTVNDKPDQQQISP